MVVLRYGSARFLVNLPFASELVQNGAGLNSDVLRDVEPLEPVLK
jgi:hypothetical protein